MRSDQRLDKPQWTEAGRYYARRLAAMNADEQIRELAEPPDSDKLVSTPDSDSVGPVVPTQPTAHRGEDTTLRRDVSSEGAE